MASMGKARNAPRRGLPHLGAALFCERILVESDQVLSLIRVIDRVEIQTRPDIEEAIAAGTFAIPLFMVLMFRAGEARGDYTFAVRVVPPEGRKPSELFQGPLTFDRAEGGTVVRRWAVTFKRG